VKQYYLSTTSVDGKEVGLRALGRVQTPELAKDVLNFQFSEKVSIQDKHFPAEVLAANSKARNTLWRYIQENWDAVHEQLAGNPVIIGQYIKFSLQKFADHDIEKEIEEFFESKDTNAYARGLATAIDTVRRNANYKDRDENLVLEWLKAHGFA
jgi:aminopeptidase N